MIFFAGFLAGFIVGFLSFGLGQYQIEKGAQENRKIKICGKFYRLEEID